MIQLNEMMNDIIAMQQKTLSYFTESNKTTLEFCKDYLQVLENNIKFHEGAKSYHDSMIKMLEVLKDNVNIFTPKNK